MGRTFRLRGDGSVEEEWGGVSSGQAKGRHEKGKGTMNAPELGLQLSPFPVENAQGAQKSGQEEGPGKLKNGTSRLRKGPGSLVEGWGEEEIESLKDSLS